MVIGRDGHAGCARAMAEGRFDGFASWLAERPAEALAPAGQ